jgi:hypothetical protein
LVDDEEVPGSRSVESFGTPGAPVVIDEKGLLFGCEKRLCSASTANTAPKLVNGAILDGIKEGAIITISKVRYAVTSLNQQLVIVRIG